MPNTVSQIPPITEAEQNAVIDETKRYIQLAEKVFGIKCRPINITFDLRGRASGMYRISRWKKEIRFNPFIFAKYYADNYANTIPHEVAHYVSDLIYGLRNIKPHGPEWQSIMHAFDADASVTSNYDLTGIPIKKQKLFNYLCDCREHRITTVRHNRIQRQRYKYYCKYCKQILKPVQQESVSS